MTTVATAVVTTSAAAAAAATTTVRPVAACLPTSSSVWEDSNLPLSIVITPFAGATDSVEGRCPFLKDFPKCLHCGAPHPTNHSHLDLAGQELLCFLCGKRCSTRFEDQQEARTEEHLERDCYCSSTSYSSSSSFQHSSTTTSTSTTNGTTMTIDFELGPPSVSAMSCPPLYWIILDGSCTSRNYWTVVATTLATIIQSAPPYVHVGLLLATNTTLTVLDLTSPTCHALHYPAATTTTLSLTPVPVGLYQSHMLSALRAIADMGTMLANHHHHGNDDDDDDDNSTMSLTQPIQTILKSCHERHHVGTTPTYAGGRILCLLSDNGVEHIQPSTPSVTPSSGRESGRAAYATQEEQYHKSDMIKHPHNTPTSNGIDPEQGEQHHAMDPNATFPIDPSDLTPNNLQQTFSHCVTNDREEQWLDQLGQQCAQAALAVDLFVLTESKQTQVGIPILQPLSQRSGAPGPIIFNIINNNDNSAALVAVLSARAPWQNNMVFGGMLRVRLSPGFDVDDTPFQPAIPTVLGPSLAPLYVQNGLMGPASSTDEQGLWCIGACDETSTVCVDIKVTNHHIQRTAYVPGRRDVVLTPCVQICFAYTIILDQRTVRRMRIVAVPLTFVSTVERIYATLDPGALLVVLVHKLAISALTQGVTETQDIGTKWLQSLMECAYTSAEDCHAHQEEQSERGYATNGDNSLFYANDRLLGRDGSSMTEDDILLGQGHERLKSIPLMIWALLQSDAFRPSFGTFRPTADARCVCLLQLASMPPAMVARVVAPPLELWDDREAIVEMDLNLENVKLHVSEHQQSGEPLLLFLHSPSLLIVCDSRHLVPNNNVKTNAAIGPCLQLTIDAAIQSYANPPPILYALDMSTSTTILWKDILLEDTISVMTGQNFKAWKRELASAVQEGLLQDEN